MKSHWRIDLLRVNSAFPLNPEPKLRRGPADFISLRTLFTFQRSLRFTRIQPLFSQGFLLYIFPFWKSSSFFIFFKKHRSQTRANSIIVSFSIVKRYFSQTLFLIRHSTSPGLIARRKYKHIFTSRQAFLIQRIKINSLQPCCQKRLWKCPFARFKQEHMISNGILFSKSNFSGYFIK